MYILGCASQRVSGGERKGGLGRRLLPAHVTCYLCGGREGGRVHCGDDGAKKAQKSAWRTAGTSRASLPRKPYIGYKSGREGRSTRYSVRGNARLLGLRTRMPPESDSRDNDQITPNEQEVRRERSEEGAIAFRCRRRLRRRRRTGTASVARGVGERVCALRRRRRRRASRRGGGTFFVGPMHSGSVAAAAAVRVQWPQSGAMCERADNAEWMGRRRGIGCRVYMQCVHYSVDSSDYIFSNMLVISRSSVQLYNYDKFAPHLESFPLLSPFTK